MKKTKIGLGLIILGNLLYCLNEVLTLSSSDFGDFISGFLFGISVGINIVGIILIILLLKKEEDHEKQR